MDSPPSSTVPGTILKPQGLSSQRAPLHSDSVVRRIKKEGLKRHPLSRSSYLKSLVKPSNNQMPWLLFFNSFQLKKVLKSCLRSVELFVVGNFTEGKSFHHPGHLFLKSLGHQSHPAKPSDFWGKASNPSGLVFDGQDVGFTLNTCGSKNALHVQLAHFVEIQGMPGRFVPGLEHLELNHLLKPGCIFADVFTLLTLVRHLPVRKCDVSYSSPPQDIAFKNAIDSEIHSGFIDRVWGKKHNQIKYTHWL